MEASLFTIMSLITSFILGPSSIELAHELVKIAELHFSLKEVLILKICQKYVNLCMNWFYSYSYSYSYYSYYNNNSCSYYDRFSIWYTRSQLILIDYICICICIYLYLYIHTHIHTHTHTHIYISCICFYYKHATGINIAKRARDLFILHTGSCPPEIKNIITMPRA